MQIYPLLFESTNFVCRTKFGRLALHPDPYGSCLSPTVQENSLGGFADGRSEMGPVSEYQSEHKGNA